MDPVLKPTSVGSMLFQLKSELEVISRSVQVWRQMGVNGTGLMPISVLPMEAKLNKVISEIDEMIRLVSKI
jgi:hypothetical protein